MPKIQTFTAPVQESTPANVRADPGMLNAQFQGVAALGAGLRDVAQSVGSIGQQIAKAEEFRAQLELDTELEAAKESFFGGLKGRNDPENWESEFQQQMTEAALVRKTTLTPGAQDRLNARRSAFLKLGATEVANAARLAKVKDATEAAEFSLQTALSRGDVQTAEGILDGMQQTGLLGPKEAEARRKTLPAIAEQNLVVQTINTRPVQALKELEEDKFKSLSEDQKYTLRNRAQEEVRKLQTRTYQGIIDATLKGQYITQPELQASVDNGLITATQMAHYKDVYLTGNGRKLNPAMASGLTVDVLSYDPANDPDKKGYVALMGRIATEGLNEDHMRTLNSELSDRVRKTDSIENATSSYLTKLADDLFESGAFGEFKDYNTLRPDGKYPTIPAQLMAARKRQADLLEAGRKFLRANPKVTEAELFKAIAPKVTTSQAKEFAKKPLFFVPSRR